MAQRVLLWTAVLLLMGGILCAKWLLGPWKKTDQPVILLRGGTPGIRGQEADIWPVSTKVKANLMFSANHGFTVNMNQPNHNIVFAGLLHHGVQITHQAMQFVVQMACQHQIKVHILGTTDMDLLLSMLQHQANRAAHKNGNSCAPIVVESHPIVGYSNRIDRIQQVRDYQREQIRQDFELRGEMTDANKATIVLADLDISSFPPSEQVIRHAHGMTVDVLCAAGLMNGKDGPLYYDIFATVLEDDTFVYPVEGRPNNKKPRLAENVSMIISEHFSAKDLYEWFRVKGSGETTATVTDNTAEKPRFSPVPVKSCFGGLALYRASIWLNEQCSYRDTNLLRSAKYANKFDMKACEHVVLNTCLHSTLSNVTIAVQPDLNTHWHQGSSALYAIDEYPELKQRYLKRCQQYGQYGNGTSMNNTNETNCIISDNNSTMDTTNMTNITNATIDSRHLAQHTPTRVQNLVDFFIVGFPKTGTTSLLKSLGKMDRVAVVDEEYCDIVSPEKAEQATSDLEVFFQQPRFSEIKQRGIKCPVAMNSQVPLSNLARHSPRVRLILGVRHPVWFFQSYYNYRVTEMYDRNNVHDVLPAESLIGSDHYWEGVSTHAARFEMFCQQLLVPRSGNAATSQTQFEVFLYALEELQDSDVEHQQAFESKLSSFLGVDAPTPILHENKNHFVNDRSHPETIDICDDQYRNLRSILVQNGKETKRWFLESFLPSQGVAVTSNVLVEHIQQWDQDPCVSKVMLS